MSEQYFTGINYSMANEDTTLEHLMMQKLRPKNIFSVCGSGGRALPLIHPDIEKLTCVDLSEQQIWLLELRIQSIMKLDLKDFLKFWGYPPYYFKAHQKDRKAQFDSFELSEPAAKFFKKVFMESDWESILYSGKWEKTFISLSKVAKIFLGKHCEKIFSFNSLDKQLAYLKNEFPEAKWNLLLRLVGNKALFNALLYKGSFVKKNIPDSYYSFYKARFSQLFTHDIAKNSFFLQLCLLGEIKHPEGVTIEGNPNAFAIMKDKLKSGFVVDSVKGDLIEVIKDQSNLDFISMSDVPSYFSGTVEKNFLQDIKPSLSPGAIIVVRSYLRVPEANRSGYQDITKEFKKEIDLEKVGVYNIEVLKYED